MDIVLAKEKNMAYTVRIREEGRYEVMATATGEERLALVGSRLKQARRFRGLTSADVADRLGIARSSLSLYEAGRRDVRLTVLLAMIDLYQVDVNYLLGFTDEFALFAPRRQVAYRYVYDDGRM